MKPLTLFGLIIATGILSATVYFQPGTTPSVTHNQILSFDPQSITRVRLTNQGSTIVFEQQNGQWVMASPEVGPAIQNRVGALILLATVHSSTSYPLTGLDLKQFDLDKPLNQLHLNEHVLSFGGIDPIRRKRYVTDGSRLHLIDSSITGLLFKPHSYFIQANPEEE